MPDGIPPVQPDEAAALAAANSRKSSILVKDEKDASRVNLQAAHPHFVEHTMPHRSASISAGSNPPSSGAQNVPEQLSRLHFGGASDSAAKRTPGSPPLVPQATRGNQVPNLASQAQAQAVAHAQAQAEAQEKVMAQHQPQPQQQSLQQQLQQQQQQQQNQLYYQQQFQHFQQQPFQQQKPQKHQQDVPVAPNFQTSPRNSHSQFAEQQQPQQPQHASFGSIRTESPATVSSMGPVPSTSSVQPGIPRVNSPGVISSDGEASGASGTVGGRSTSKQPSDPRIPMNDGRIHILIGLTGSLHISSVKSMIAKLQSIYGDRVAIQVILTTAAEKLVASARAGGEATGPAPTSHPLREREHHSNVQIWHDNDEWDTWHGRNDPVIHIELRRWADILVIAPLSANTLGKIAMGLCDNLLTNVVRAWNSQYPILIAPAMVSYAYNHPATKHHLKVIKEEMKWIEILRPTEKVAGSTGGIGMGGMMPWNEIVDRIVHKLGGYPDEDDDDDDDDDRDERQPNDFEDDEDDDDDAGDILTEGFDSGASADVPKGSPI